MINIIELYNLIDRYLFIFPSKEDAVKYIFNNDIKSFTRMPKDEVERKVNENLSKYLKKQFEDQKLIEIVNKYISIKKRVTRKEIVFIDSIIRHSGYTLMFEDYEALLRVMGISKQVRLQSNSDILLIQQLIEFKEMTSEIEEENSDYDCTNDLYDQYRKDFKKFDLLEAEEEKELLRKYKLEGDQEAFDKLVCCNVRLCESVARKRLNRGLSLMDLIQEGNIGLITAIQRFDITKGNKLSTYATWWIYHMIDEAIAKRGSTIRIPKNMIEDQYKLNRAENAYLNEFGIEPTIEELAELSGLTIAKVNYIKQHEITMVSFDKKIITEDDTGSTIGDFIESKDDLPEEEIEKENRSTILNKHLVKLGKDRKLHDAKRLEQIMRLRLGIEVYTKETYDIINDSGFELKDNYILEDIGKIFGVTREAIRQQVSKGVERLEAYGVIEDLFYESDSIMPEKKQKKKKPEE